MKIEICSERRTFCEIVSQKVRSAALYRYLPFSERYTMFADADTLADVPVSDLIRAECFHHLPQPALLFDPSGRLLECNRAAAELHSVRPNNEGGLHIEMFFPPDVVTQLTFAIGTVRTKGDWQGVLTITTAGNVHRTAQFGLAEIAGLIIATYVDVTNRGYEKQERREETRWTDTANNIRAVVREADPAPWAIQAANFVAGADEAFQSIIDRGSGRTVLIAGFGPVMHQVLEAFLGRCQYLTVGAELPSVADKLSQNIEYVRTAILGPNASEDAVFAIRRRRPLLPIVTVGWKGPSTTPLTVLVEPKDFVRAVAESVGEDHLNDALAECGFDFPDFTIS